MKKIVVKRLVYTNAKGARFIGGEEYEGTLSDEQILGLIHEAGKTFTFGNGLVMIKNGFKITVEPFYKLEQSWYDSILATLRRG